VRVEFGLGASALRSGYSAAVVSQSRRNDDWERAAQDLDHEDAEIRRKDVADQAAGVKPERAPKHEKPDATKT
jgi:hypothetical protein